MKKLARNLPDFSRPPLSEVVLSIQFGSLTNLKGIHLGLFWKQFRKQYPDVTEQSPIQTIFETFGVPHTARTTFQLQTFLSPPMPRYWFEKTGKPDLLQIQHDRIVHNWRIGEGAVSYPRYERVKAKLEKEFLAFAKWLDSERLGEIRPNQCEVTYTNLIEIDESDRVHADLSRLTPFWTDAVSEHMPAELEDITTSSRFIFSHNEKPVGRVYVQFQPVFRQSDLHPMIKLEITARGQPEGETISDALAFLDVEHAQVVQTFAAVTSKEMHKAWGRKDVSRRQ
jgi:uncharacterized protein (TIGR04255 family)